MLKRALIICLIACSARADDTPLRELAVELKSGTVVGVDGKTYVVEPGSSYLPKSVTLATGKRIAQCETENEKLRRVDPGDVAIFTALILFTAGIAYTYGKASK